MNRFLRIDDLSQNIPCNSCRTQGPVLERRRAMNFTTNIVQLICPNCRVEIARIPFHRWNDLHRKTEKTQNP